MATIAFFQNRLGRTDGVSLEVDKWRRVIRDRWGDRVLYCSGNDDVPGNIVLPELYAHHPVTWRILQNGTVAFRDYVSEAALEKEIYDHADTIEARLLEVIRREGIDVIVPNNLCSGGYQPAAAIAFHRVIRRTGIPTLLHSHDFYFEASGEVRATCQTVSSIYERYFPSKLPNVQHVVINRLAQQELQRRKGITSRVVPNVFDFDQQPWTSDAFNADFRAAFGIRPHDLVLLQATRILDRKGIELAIELVAALQDPRRRGLLNGVRTAAGEPVTPDSRIVLLCAGIIETIGISSGYWEKLRARARAREVDLRHVGDRVRHSRAAGVGADKVYSLWDAYTQADLVTYPSTWEGWGNQFIEAVFARLPIVVFEYPVWKSDLEPLGFRVVSLGDRVSVGSDGLVDVPPEKLAAAASAVVEILRDRSWRDQMTETNFALGRRHFSLDALETAIRPLFGKRGGAT